MPIGNRGVRGTRGMRSRGGRGGHVSFISSQDTLENNAFTRDGDKVNDAQGFILASYNTNLSQDATEIGFCSMLSNNA